ncbi:MAG: 4Fe-4S dicluster domain-containing protein [Desulfobulbaceae bacterium]|nr:4Fe-4S dicluster domain-containing protein [Desulfobulbaceae bacterium]
MSKPSFVLTSDSGGSIQDGPAAAVLHVPLNGHSIKTVKKKAVVAAGALIAEHPDAGIGDMHTPVAGVVTNISAKSITIDTGAEIKEDAKVIGAEKIDVSTLSGDELLSALKRLGIDTAGIGKAGTLVINGVNPEPGISAAGQIVGSNSAILEKGLGVLQKIVSASKTILAVPQGGSASLSGAVTENVSPVYPNSVDQLVVKAVTGQEGLDDVTVVSIHQLLAIGKVAETGLPLTETVMTVGTADYTVKVGTPVSQVLAQAGVSAVAGDRLISGGPMRGVAIYDKDQGVGKNDYGLFVVSDNAFPPVTDTACVNCGECVAACPARLSVNMIGRFAEFGLYEKAREYGIDYCFECGMCGFYCTARRPLVQLIRLAKSELAAMDAAAAA